MAEDGRYTGGSGHMDDWPDLDWLEEVPQPRQAQPPRQSAGDSRQTQPPRQTYQQIDWQEETPRQTRQSDPVRRPAQQRPAQQRPAQQRPAQQRPAQQRPAQQRPAQQRPAQQRPAQQRPAQQRPAQQRPAQQRPAQQRPAQQRPAQQRPAQQRPAQRSRYVEVEPDDYRPKRRGLQKQSIPLIILVVILVGGILVAGVKLGSALLNYQRDRSAYDHLADEALSGLAEPNATHDPNAQADADAGQQAPSEAPFAVNWDYLRSVNSDVVGWIYCADTKINYPVVQTVDNEFYLHRAFDTKQPNTAGTLFVDPNATLGVVYSNYVIYGHNMKDGSMFASLESYVSQDYYEQHPVMYLLTPEQNYRIDVIAGRIVEATLDNYPFYFSDADYGTYLNTITSRSFFGSHAGISTNYQLITLSTCDYSGGYSNPRFLLQGLLVPIT